MDNPFKKVVNWLADTLAEKIMEPIKDLTDRVDKLERDLELKEKEIYDLKHDLISNQIKTETAETRAKELEAENKELLLNKTRLEATLEDKLLDGMGSKKNTTAKK